MIVRAAMSVVERFHAVMNFQPVDRLPVMEWAPWWNLTLDRWRNEGLDRSLESVVAIAEHLGLEPIQRIGIAARGKGCPAPAHHGAAIITAPTFAGYARLKPDLYPAAGFDEVFFADAIRRRDQRHDTIVWVILDGYFWFPRTILGIEDHLYAFCDAPDLMIQMNTDLQAHQLRQLDKMLAIGTPDVISISEDMSYNHGPMLSKAHFDQIVGPFYQPIMARLADRRCVVLIDSDGDVHELVRWTTAAGVPGVLPLERQAGVDVAKLRDENPKLQILGAFDKMVMKEGPAAIERELQRLLPTMRRGGFIPSVDHQTPPEVPLENYRQYVKLLRRYCELAAQL